jgi:hypothetical protein
MRPPFPFFPFFPFFPRSSAFFPVEVSGGTRAPFFPFFPPRSYEAEERKNGRSHPGGEACGLLPFAVLRRSP